MAIIQEKKNNNKNKIYKYIHIYIDERKCNIACIVESRNFFLAWKEILVCVILFINLYSNKMYKKLFQLIEISKRYLLEGYSKNNFFFKLKSFEFYIKQF